MEMLWRKKQRGPDFMEHRRGGKKWLMRAVLYLVVRACRVQINGVALVSRSTSLSVGPCCRITTHQLTVWSVQCPVSRTDHSFIRTSLFGRPQRRTGPARPGPGDRLIDWWTSCAGNLWRRDNDSTGTLTALVSTPVPLLPYY